MGEPLRHRLGQLADPSGLLWHVLIPAVFFALTALGVGGVVFWQSLRDGLTDLVSADLKVWHLLLAIGAVAAVAGMVVRQVRRAGPIDVTEAWMQRAPREIAYFGVLWSIAYPRGGGIRVGKPMCHRDRSTLAYVVQNKVQSLPDDWDKHMTAPEMNFVCPKEGCGAKYDLTGRKYHMKDLLNLVHDVAIGAYRKPSAAARAGQERK